MSNDHKVKGLLKGLRFISQIFDNNEKEKEPEIEIGHPTDVRHVAHIGWDGPSENSPGWMNGFKSVPGISSAPQNPNGDIDCKGPDNSTKRASAGRNSLEVPKSSKRQSNSTGNMRETHAKEKSDRASKPKRSSKNSHTHSNDSLNGSKPTEQAMSNNDKDSSDLPPPDIPKRSRSKKSKDGSIGGSGSSKSRSKAHPRDSNSIEGPPSGSSSKSRTRNRNRSCEEDGQLERGSKSNQDILIN